MKKEKRVFLEKYSFIPWIAVVILALLIFYLSSISIKGGKGAGLGSFFYHLLIFFWFAFFFFIAITKGRKITLFLPAIFIALMYAVSDEVHQKFVPFRSCSFSDFLVDSAGILLAAVIYIVTIRMRSRE